MCQLHEIVVRTTVNKGIKLNSPAQTLPVMVRFVHLEGTLLPFRKIGSHCPGKVVRTVPLQKEMPGFQPVDCDDRLAGHLCYITNGKVRYFVSEGQKYYRLGDLLNLKTMVHAVLLCRTTANFVYYWSILCQHIHSLKELRQRRVRKNLLTKRCKELTVAGKTLTKTMSKTHRQHQMVCEGARACTTFLRKLHKGMSQVGPPRVPIRSTWMRWNQADLEMDCFRSPSEMEDCQR